VKVSSDGTAADGSRIAYSYTARFDGKDYVISGTGVPNGAKTIAIQRLSPNTTEATLKKSGKVVLTARSVVAKSGKAMKLTGNGADAKGKPVSNVTYWDKQ
jgi:hypothetical protein